MYKYLCVYVCILVNTLEKMVRGSLVREVSHKVGVELNEQIKINMQGSRSLVRTGIVINCRAEMKSQGRQLQSDA